MELQPNVKNFLIVTEEEILGNRKGLVNCSQEQEMVVLSRRKDGSYNHLTKGITNNL